MEAEYQLFMALPVAEREAIHYNCFLKEIAGYSQLEQEKLKEEYKIVYIKMLKYREDINEKERLFNEAHPDLDQNSLRPTYGNLFISGSFRVFWMEDLVSLNPNLIKY